MSIYLNDFHDLSFIFYNDLTAKDSDPKAVHLQWLLGTVGIFKGAQI